MSRWLTLWQKLPKLHRRILVLLPLFLVGVLLLKVVLRTDTASVVLPPLPEVAVSTEGGATMAVQELPQEAPRLADRRPLLDTPGLQFSQASPTSNRIQAARSEPPAVESRTPQTSTESTDKNLAERPTQKAPVGGTSSPMPAAGTPGAAKSDKLSSPSATKSVESKSAGSVRFANLPDDAWLLQIAAVSNAEDAKNRCAKLTIPCISYAANRQGKRVWIMVAGPYSNRESAQAAAHKLPLEMQQGPFPRKVVDVRKDASD